MERSMIYPKCKFKDNQVMAIRYDGYVVPCCHFGSWEQGKEILDFLGDLKEQIHITSGTLEEINCSEAYQKLDASFTDNPLPTCIRQCSEKINLGDDKTLANSDFAKIKLRK